MHAARSMDPGRPTANGAAVRDCHEDAQQGRGRRSYARVGVCRFAQIALNPYLASLDLGRRALNANIEDTGLDFSGRRRTGGRDKADADRSVTNFVTLAPCSTWGLQAPMNTWGRLQGPHEMVALSRV